jgi:hypothetical protein
VRPTLNEERVFIQHPDNWPRWPLLPLKRYNANAKPGEFYMDCGFLIDPTCYKQAEAKMITVFKGDIWSLDAIVKIVDIPVWKSYPTIDAILADGWQVD